MTRTYTYTRTDTDLCQRCEHPADWHRHDDSTAPFADGHNSHGLLIHDTALCPCRCLGYDCTTDGPIPPGGQACDCPSFVPDTENPERSDG